MCCSTFMCLERKGKSLAGVARVIYSNIYNASRSVGSHNSSARGCICLDGFYLLPSFICQHIFVVCVSALAPLGYPVVLHISLWVSGSSGVLGVWGCIHCGRCTRAHRLSAVSFLSLSGGALGGGAVRNNTTKLFRVAVDIYLL